MHCENCGKEIERNFKKGIIAATTLAIVLVVFICIWLHNAPARQLAKQLDLGNRYLEEMDYEQAVVAFTKAIEIDPMSVDAYIGAAEAYVGLDDMDEAIMALEKGYELTDDEEILRMLEELRESREEYSETREIDEVVVEENEENALPYFELGFSPEDFTIAGYSIMDGNHLVDVEQAVAVMMPMSSPYDTDYVGWNYGKQDYLGELDRVEIYYNNGNSWSGAVGYAANNGGVALDVDSVSVEYLVGVTIDEFPLYEGKIVPNVTSYEETLEILGIGQLIQAVEETEYVMFESQYGYGYCSKVTIERYMNSNMTVCEYQISMQKSELSWNLAIYFYDNVLCSIELRSGDMM